MNPAPAAFEADQSPRSQSTQHGPRRPDAPRGRRVTGCARRWVRCGRRRLAARQLQVLQPLVRRAAGPPRPRSIVTRLAPRFFAGSGKRGPDSLLKLPDRERLRKAADDVEAERAAGLFVAEEAGDDQDGDASKD